MKQVLAFGLLVLLTRVMPQSPVKATLAYSRKTIPGIPGSHALPPTYYLYVVINRGVAISLRGACVEGRSYDATLRRVATPVLVDHDVGVPTGRKDTLVEKTSDDVYQVALADAAGACGGHEAELARRHEVVVCLASSATKWYGLVAKMVPLAPAAAP